MVWIRYKDKYNKTWVWSHGFLPCEDWKRTNYDVVVRNEWYHYQSPNLLNISTTRTKPYNQPIYSPPPKKITGIFIGGKGWDRCGRFANVKILGEEIQQPPVAVIQEYKIIASVSSPITFDGSNSYDPDGTIQKYSWDFDASNGIQEETIGKEVEYSYSTLRTYFVTLTDSSSKSPKPPGFKINPFVRPNASSLVNSVVFITISFSCLFV